jgi:CRISPR-associated protein Cas2
MLYAIAYDIPDDTRRLRVADALLDFGRRVQYSVFEAQLDDGLLQRLRERLAGLIEAPEDSVRIYRLCGGCEAVVEVMGQGGRTVIEKVYIV